jgi:hypothetical protein
MDKFVPALVFVVLLASTTEATTLTITEGSVLNVLSLGDTFFDFAGDGFSASGVRAGGQDQVLQAFSTGIAGVGFVENSVVSVGGVSCIADNALSPSCGFITLNSRPLTLPPAGWPATVPFTDSALFTASGHLNVGEDFDIQGWGTVVGTFCPLCENGNSTNVRYTFSVPEPSTFYLVAGGLMVLLSKRGERIFRSWRSND